MNLHDLRQAQAGFDITEITDKRKSLHKLRQAFVKDFNPRFLAQMKIDAFVEGKTKDSFCYRIEWELDGLGRITGSPSIKFGVYYSKEQSNYVFAKKWGENHIIAFENIRQALLDLLEAGKNRDLAAIVASKISPMFKGKILSVYYPELYLNVFSPDHLNYYLGFYGLDTDENIHADAVYKREALVAYKNSDAVMKDWSVDLFSHFLYDRYPKSPAKETLQSSELSEYHYPDFPINPTPTEIQLDILPFESSDKSTGKKSGKNTKLDYEKEQRLLKKLGDRGEEIVKRFEIDRLKALGLNKQACKVERVSLKSDAYGYDILSYNEDKTERCIEVKATRAKAGEANFFLTQNEFNTAKEKQENYYIYMVFDILSHNPQIWIIPNPFSPENKNVLMEPVNYRVKINVKK